MNTLSLINSALSQKSIVKKRVGEKLKIEGERERG